jgi:hypothetical protein
MKAGNLGWRCINRDRPEIFDQSHLQKKRTHRKAKKNCKRLVQMCSVGDKWVADERK